jgi:probable rRNA maturation factor
MKLLLDLQADCADAALPTASDCDCWVRAALAGRRERAELTIRFVDESEGAALNQRYRGRTGATNVLSFPFDPPPGFPEAIDLLGDLVICAPVAVVQAADRCKPLRAHWAHLVVHGVLHLLGHDHEDAREADVMEALESDILRGLGFAGPYEEIESSDDD